MSRQTGVFCFLLAIAAAVGALLALDADTLRPNLVLVVIDTLRADCVDPDAPDPPMPFVSGLAKHGVYYERAYSPTSWTLPSVASLFLASRPSEHGVGAHGWGTGLPEQGPTLAMVLRDAGFATAARVAHPGLTEERVGRGFEDFSVIRTPLAPTDATTMNEAAFEWLDSREEGPPFFLYLHYMDVHGPYRVHPGLTAPREPQVGRSDKTLGSTKTAEALLFKREGQRRRAWSYTASEVQRMRQLYDGECRHLDRSLEALFRGLRERGLLERSVVVVTSDHGEEFGAHEIYAHGGSLFGAAVRVPLLVLHPDRVAERIAAAVEIAGLGPALLQELGLPVPAEFRVPSIPPLRVLAGGAAATAYVELPSSHLQVHLHSHGVASGTQTLLVSDDGAEDVYELDARGLEAARSADPARAAALGSALDRIRSGLAKPGVPAVRDLDAEQLEQLRDLGYVE